jgi:hypothetical protein
MPDALVRTGAEGEQSRIALPVLGYALISPIPSVTAPMLSDSPPSGTR